MNRKRELVCCRVKPDEAGAVRGRIKLEDVCIKRMIAYEQTRFIGIKNPDT